MKITVEHKGTKIAVDDETGRLTDEFGDPTGTTIAHDSSKINDIVNNAVRQVKELTGENPTVKVEEHS